MVDALMQMRPIGLLHSVFQFKNGTPRQPALCGAARGSLTVDKSVFNNPEHALEGLQEFSHAWIVFVFHKNQPGHTKAKVRPPILNGKRVGVFSTRSPYRPNAIGLTLARIERISGPTVHFSGIDIIDGTPVLDIKPFIPQYDVPECRGESSPEDSCGANTDEHVAVKVSSHPKTMSGNVETVSSDHQPVKFSQQFRDPVTKYEKMSDSIPTAEREERCLVESHHTDETTRNYVHIAASCLASPQSFYSPYSQPEAVESSRVIADRNTETSSDGLSQHKREDEVNHQMCDEKLKSSQDITEENFHSTVQKQTSTSFPQPQPQFKDCPPLTTTVAPWLSAPPVTKLRVSFAPAAEAQLQKFKTGNFTGADNPYRLEHLSGVEDVRRAIVSMLAEDPRSVYRRQKCCDFLYFFTVDQVHVTCWFDDKENQAEVVRLQPVSFVEKLQFCKT